MERPVWRCTLVAVLLVIGAACGDDGGGSEAASPATSTTAAPVTVPVAEPAEVEATPIEPRVEARLELPGGPDWLATGAGSVWVKMDDGTVSRIDPATNRVTAEIEVADQLCQGLGASDEAVWSCADGGVVRIDPATERVAATVDVEKIADQGQIPVAFGRAWVLTGDGSTLAGIEGDEVADEVDLGTRCTELTASAAAIWAACPIDGMAVAVDPEAGAVSATVEGLPDARQISAAEHVFVGFSGGVARVDEASATVDAVADATSGLSGDVEATGDAVWVRTGGRFLRRVDPETMEVVEDLEAPEVSGGAALVAFGSVWATAYDDGVLYRVTPTG